MQARQGFGDDAQVFALANLLGNGAQIVFAARLVPDQGRTADTRGVQRLRQVRELGVVRAATRARFERIADAQANTCGERAA